MKAAPIAAIAYGLTGILLMSALLLLPDGRQWQREDALYLKEAAHIGRQVAAETFPDWDVANTPYLVLKGRVNYLVNFPAGAEVPPGQPAADPDFRVLRLDRPEFPGFVATAYDLNGQKVAVMPSKPVLDRTLTGLMEAGNLAGGESGVIRSLLKLDGGTRVTPEQYVASTLHEAFHAYQLPVLFGWADRIEAREPAGNGSLSVVYRDEQNNRWQDEEAQLLHQAAMAADEAEVRRLAARFLMVRERRWAYWEEQHGTAGAAAHREWEALYEWAEGLARYIEIRTWQLGARSDYQPVEGLADEPLYQDYRDRPDSGPGLFIGQIGQPVSRENTHERVYRLGAAQALLLDRLLPDWHEEAARGVSLSELLQRGVNQI